MPKELPCEWQPNTVPNSQDNDQPFTEAGAWELIADLLDNKEQQVTIKSLDTPEGVIAYIMEMPLSGGGMLYIKIHFGHGPTVLGRSFHYSDY